MRQANLEKTGDIFLKDLPILHSGYSLWREGLLSSLNRAAPKYARTKRDEYLKELNDPEAGPDLLVALDTDPMKALDEPLYDALQQCIKGDHAELVLGKIKDAKSFGNGRVAVKVLDKHFHFSNAASALAARQMIFKLKCTEMRKAEVAMQTFRDLRNAMGEKDHKMIDVLGISSLRNAFSAIKDLVGAVSTHRAGADSAKLDPFIAALDSRSRNGSGKANVGMLAKVWPRRKLHSMKQNNNRSISNGRRT